jgi:hypothetical protein
MSLTAEQAAELANEVDATTETTDAPASGEQPATEHTEETSTETTEETPEGDKNEAEGDKPEEKKADDEKAKAEATKKAEAWQQVEAAKKAQVQVAQARRRLEQDAERVRGYEAQLQTREKQLDAREARVTKLEQALQSHDLDTLIDLGFDYEAATRRALENSDPAKRIERLEREQRERDERAKKEREERAKQEQAQAAIAQTRRDAQALVQIVDEEGPTDFPELYLWQPERIAQEGIAFRDAYARKHGQMPTYEIVLTALQKTAKAEATAAEQRRSGLQQKRGPTSSDAGSARKADTRPNSGAANTPALSPTDAAQRVTPPREKTDAEIDEECRQMLRGLKR